MKYLFFWAFIVCSLFCGQKCVIFDKKSLPKDYIRDGLRLNNGKNDVYSSSSPPIKQLTSLITDEIKDDFDDHELDDPHHHQHDQDDGEDEEGKLFTDDEKDTKDLAEYLHKRSKSSLTSDLMPKNSHNPSKILSSSASFFFAKNRQFAICENFLRRKQGLKKISQSLRYHVDIDDHKQLDLNPAIPREDIMKCVKSLDKIENQERNRHPPIIPQLTVTEHNLWPSLRAHNHRNRHILQRPSDGQLAKLFYLLNNSLESRIRPSSELGKIPILGKRVPMMYSGLISPFNQISNKDLTLLNSDQGRPLMSNYKQLFMGVSPLNTFSSTMFTDKVEHSPFSGVFSPDEHHHYDDSEKIKKKLIDSHLGIIDVEKFNGDRKLEIDGGPKTVIVHEGQLHVHPRGEVGHIELVGNNVKKYGPRYISESPINGAHQFGGNQVNSLFRFMPKTFDASSKYPSRQGNEYDYQNSIYSNNYHFKNAANNYYQLDGKNSPEKGSERPNYEKSDSFESTNSIKQCGPKGPNGEINSDCPVTSDGIKAKYMAKSPFHKINYAKYGSKYLALRLSTIANYAMGNLMGILYAPFMRNTNSPQFVPIKGHSSSPIGNFNSDKTNIEEEIEHLMSEDEEIEPVDSKDDHY